MSRDLRRYSRQTNFRLFLGGLVVLILVGDGLIYIFYGDQAAIAGLACLMVGLAPILLIWAALWLVGWFARKGREC